MRPIAPGYHNLPDATAAAFAGGWYHTGDLAQRDEDGFLTVSGRIKELIIRGGENIYPAEVEATLMLHDAVADAAVVSRPHEALGEVPVAFIGAAAIERAASAAADQIEPTADLHGSVDFRRDLTREMVRQALTQLSSQRVS